MKTYGAIKRGKLRPILPKSNKKYDFRSILNSLGQGESFLIGGPKEYNALRQFCYNYGYKIITRSEGVGRRVWRIG